MSGRGREALGPGFSPSAALPILFRTPAFLARAFKASLSKVEELDVASLIEKCWPLRLDLDYEDDIAFIEQERGSTSIRRRHVERLLRCCRKLGLIGPSTRLPR